MLLSLTLYLGSYRNRAYIELESETPEYDASCWHGVFPLDRYFY